MVHQKQPKIKHFGLFFTHFRSIYARLSVCSNKNRKILLEQNAILFLLAKTLENAENGSVLIKVLIKLKTFVQERRLFLLLLTIVLPSLQLFIYEKRTPIGVLYLHFDRGFFHFFERLFVLISKIFFKRIKTEFFHFVDCLHKYFYVFSVLRGWLFFCGLVIRLR